MEVYLAINSTVQGTRFAANILPNEVVSEPSRLHFCYQWVECEPAVKLMKPKSWPKRVAHEILKIRGEIGLALNVVCTPGVENCKAELVLDDKDGVVAKVMKKAGMKPKGDIIVSFWGKPSKFEGLVIKDSVSPTVTPKWSADGSINTYGRIRDLLGKEHGPNIHPDTFEATIRLIFD